MSSVYERVVASLSILIFQTKCSFYYNIVTPKSCDNSTQMYITQILFSVNLTGNVFYWYLDYLGFQ